MPRIQLFHGSHTARSLKSGDVLMVNMKLTDKVTGKPYTWLWLGAVVRPLGGNGAKMIRFGVEGGEKKDTLALKFGNGDDKSDIFYIPPEEWPDGVHAFRTRLILEGRLDDAIF